MARRFDLVTWFGRNEQKNQKSLKQDHHCDSALLFEKLEYLL
jgi:hypothetical protein